MLVRYIALSFVSAAAGGAIAAGYFAFISFIGIFPKLLEKVKCNRHYLLIECLLAYGASLANVIYIFYIRIPITYIGLCFLTFSGGVFTGCLAGALAEVLNIFPILQARFKIRKGMSALIYAAATGKLLGSIVGLFYY